MVLLFMYTTRNNILLFQDNKISATLVNTHQSDVKEISPYMSRRDTPSPLAPVVDPCCTCVNHDTKYLRGLYALAEDIGFMYIPA